MDIPSRFRWLTALQFRNPDLKTTSGLCDEKQAKDCLKIGIVMIEDKLFLELIRQYLGKNFQEFLFC
jgi:hypothetical protein